MARRGLFGAKRGIDKVSLGLVSVLIGLAFAGAYAALHFGWFRSPWEMAIWLAVGLAFIWAGVGVRANLPARTTDVYGAAKPASETEAQAAARGEVKSSLHDQTFPD
jgi:hypothetical protein